MYYFQGFVGIEPLVDNDKDVVAEIGELSDVALTYAKNKGNYFNAGAGRDIVITCFYSRNNDEYVDAPVEITDNAIKLGQFLYNESKNNALGKDSETLKENIINEFDSFENVVLGELVQSGDAWFPSWIQYEDTSYENKNEVHLWLQNEAFENQYNHYFIDVVPPMDDIDDFFKDPLEVKSILDEYDIQDRLNQVNVTRGDYPYTVVRVQNYLYTNPANEDQSYESHWIAIIWGQAGDNPDAIKEAIKDWVLDHSDHDEEEWEKVLPDLFKNTEYLLIPFWNKYSVPNKALQGGIYAPWIYPNDDIKTVQKYTVGNKRLTNDWIAKNAEYSVYIFKSIAFASTGNPDIRDGIYRLSERFPDYFIVTNDSADFNRMSESTQRFLDYLEGAFKLAESLTEYSTVTDGYSRVIRDGLVYATFTYQNINYLMLAKASMEGSGFDTPE